MDDFDIIILAASSSKQFIESCTLLQEDSTSKNPSLTVQNATVQTTAGRRRNRSMNEPEAIRPMSITPPLTGGKLLPKTLLPIMGERTLLSNLLLTLAEAGVQTKHHIFIVVKKSEQALIASQLDKIGRFSGAVTKKISLVPLDNSESEHNDSCSGSSQGQGQSPEQSLSGDLIASPEDLKGMFLKTRLEASPSSTAMWCLFGQTPWADAPLPGKSDKEKVMPDKLYTSDENSNLVNVQEMGEYENCTLIDSNLTMNDKIGSSTTFFTQQSDLHTYMLQPWLFDFFVSTRKIKTYKDLPFEHIKKSENPEQFVSFEYSLSSLSDSIESIGIDINSDYGTLSRQLLLHCKREYEELRFGDIDIDLDIFENVYGRKELDKVCVKMVRGVCNSDFKSLRAKNLLSYVEGVRQLLKQSKKNLLEKECSGDFYQKTKSYSWG